jgi:hypothetical protein
LGSSLEYAKVGTFVPKAVDMSKRSRARSSHRM